MTRPHGTFLALVALLALPALAARPRPTDMAKDARQALALANPPFLNDPATRDRCNAYLDGMSAAVCAAWGSWQNQAFLTGVVINGPNATGGQIIGPLVAGEVNAKAPQGWNCNQAIASGFSAAFGTWAASVKVPGLAWYPSFAYVQAAFAPPTPNRPSFLNTLTSRQESMSKGNLRTEMVRNLGIAGKSDLMAQAMVDAMAGAIEQAFKAWIVTTLVTDVQGTGPIPTFAPGVGPGSPGIPGGPVLNGFGTMNPGGFR